MFAKILGNLFLILGTEPICESLFRFCNNLETKTYLIYPPTLASRSRWGSEVKYTNNLDTPFLKETKWVQITEIYVAIS
jgi:hypothetical protein